MNVLILSRSYFSPVVSRQNTQRVNAALLSQDRRAGRTAGTFGGFGAPDWNVNASVSYARDRYSITLQTRYISDGVVDPRYLEPGDAGYNAANVFTINDNDVDSAIYTALSARYELPMGGDRSWELFGAINNLFDKDPPLVPDAFYPTNTTYFDQIGRTFRVGVRADF